MVPVVLVISLLFRQAQATASDRAVPLIPSFLVAFIALVLLGSLQIIPPQMSQQASHASRACLVLAIAAGKLLLS